MRCWRDSAAAFAAAAMLLAQAQQLNVLERVARRLDLRRGDAAHRACLQQPLDGIGGGDAGGQREDARGVDERNAAVHLEIDALDAGIVLRRLQFAEPAERRPVPQRVVGHLLQEPRIGLRAGRHVGAQRVGELRLRPTARGSRRRRLRRAGCPDRRGRSSWRRPPSTPGGSRTSAGFDAMTPPLHNG